MTDKEIARRYVQLQLMRKSLWHYCSIRSPDFYNDDTWYLKEICNTIQDFITNDDELLVVNAPPRHGKTRTSTNTSEWLLGNNPRRKIMTGSYNEILSTKFSRRVRDSIMQNQRLNEIVFADVFPNVRIKRGLSAVNMWALDGSPEENYLATSPQSTATGIGADWLIIDDIIKNNYEASNAQILEKHWEWFTDNLYQRLEGERKILVFMTRWATKDLAGRLIDLMESQKRKYKVLSYRACTNGKMLNDNVLNYTQYQNVMQTVGEAIARANYDQEPIDLKGVLYDNFILYDEEKGLPEFIRINAVCDTADTGNDYLCNIIYGITKERYAYILDVYYSQDSMEITENEVARRLTEYKASIFYPESNNGGRGFSRAVEAKIRAMGNRFTICKPFHQTQNKEARILSNATSVMLNIRFPSLWKYKYPEFYRDVSEYQRTGKNAHDDAPDTLTLIVEKITKGNGIQV